MVFYIENIKMENSNSLNIISILSNKLDQKIVHLWFSLKQRESKNLFNKERCIYRIIASTNPDFFKIGQEVEITTAAEKFADGPIWDDAIYLGVGYFSRVDNYNTKLEY